MKKYIILLSFASTIIFSISCGNKNTGSVPLWEIQDGDTIAVYKTPTAEEFCIIPGYYCKPETKVLSMRISDESKIVAFDLVYMGLIAGCDNLSDHKDELFRINDPNGLGLVYDDPNHPDYVFIYFKPDGLPTDQAFGANVNKVLLDKVLTTAQAEDPTIKYKSKEDAYIHIALIALFNAGLPQYFHFINFKSESGLVTRVMTLADREKQSE